VCIPGVTVHLRCVDNLPPRRYVVVQIPRETVLNFCELQVYVKRTLLSRLLAMLVKGIAVLFAIFTFRMSRRRRETYVGHAFVCASVCLSVAACPHYCTDRDVAWRNGRGVPLVVHCWADLQSVQGFVAMTT